MSKFVNYFKGLSKPIRFTSYAYIGTLILYNGVSTYNDAQNKLIAYRNNTLKQHEKEYIKDEWSAVKYGAEEFYVPRFFNSLIWPIKMCANIIPSVVLIMNKESKESNESNELKEVSTGKTEK